MSTYIPDEMKHYKALLESFSAEGSVGMNPTHVASPDQQDDVKDLEATWMDANDAEQEVHDNVSEWDEDPMHVDGQRAEAMEANIEHHLSKIGVTAPITRAQANHCATSIEREHSGITSDDVMDYMEYHRMIMPDDGEMDEGNEFSGARNAAVKAGKHEFEVDGKKYPVTVDEEIDESNSMDNFTPEDIKHLEQLPDLETMKMFAKKLIATPSRRPMKPQKVMWLTQAIDAKQSPTDLIKLMYDLLLGGEGHSVIGNPRGMNPNSYRRTFGEDSVDEGVTTNQFQEPKHHASHAEPDWDKEGTTSQNYSKGETSKWDSYMSNESEDDSDENYSAAEQHAWDKKGSNESVNWDEMVLEAKADLAEKWAGDTKLDPKKKGMFAGKTKAELQKSYNKLKASGPHKAGSTDNTKMKELAFAIRAKGDWGKVKESVATTPVVDNSEENAILDRIRQLSGLK